MAGNTKIVDLDTVRQNEILLNSGRQIRVNDTFKNEVVEIVEPEGTISMSITLTETGPVVNISGAKLEIQSTESIKLESKKVELIASEEANIKSSGQVQIASADKLSIDSDDDVAITGKMVYLN